MEDETYEWNDELVNTYFDFLVNDYGFIERKSCSISREIHKIYLKDFIAIDIAFDGGYWVNLLKFKQKEGNLINGNKQISEFECWKDYVPFAIRKLDYKKKFYNSVQKENFKDFDLWYNSNLIKQNLSILKGDVHRFSLFNRFLGWLGMIH